MDMRAFLRSGTILFQHNPSVPVGIPNTARVDGAGKLRLGITFAPDGDSARADEVCNLVKSGIIRNLSIGFTPIDAVPLDPKKPRAGLRIKRSELAEVSFVSIGSDTGAVVTARDWNARARGTMRTMPTTVTAKPTSSRSSARPTNVRRNGNVVSARSRCWKDQPLSSACNKFAGGLVRRVPPTWKQPLTACCRQTGLPSARQALFSQIDLVTVVADLAVFDLEI